MIRPTRHAGVSIVALVLAAAALWAQEPAPPSLSFGEELSVEVINVEVYVTDRKGRPVTGLTRADFRLFEDGDAVEITYFSAFEGGAVAARVAPAEAGAAPAEEDTAAREPRHLVIYLDDANLAPAGRRRVLADLREVIATGRDGADRRMLVVHDGGLQIVQPFTDDRGAVLTALADRVTGGIFRAREREAAVRAIKAVFEKYEGSSFCSSPCECGWREMEAIVREYAGVVAAHVGDAVGSLSQIASALSGVPGRKFVLYVADGLEQRPGMDLFHYVGQLCPQYEHELARNYLAYDQAPLYGRLTAHANANGVTFYTLEALGLQTDADVSEMSPKFQTSTMTRRIAAANRQNALFQIANDTGGRAVLNANTFDAALERIATDWDIYYSLGFTSRHRGDGRLHRLKVEVVGRGLEVRHRNYYRDKELETRTAERVWSALLLGTGSNPLGAELATGKGRLHGRGCCTVPVEIRLPLDRVSLTPANDSSLGRVFVMLTARDAEGETIPVKGREIPIRVGPGEEAAEASRTFVIDVDLIPGRYEIAVGLLDLQGGGEAYLRTEVEVEPSDPSAPVSGGSEEAEHSSGR
jgi:VWFA-related protein